MYCTPPRVTSEPNVAPQHVIVCVLVFVLESLAFPPEVPNSIAPDCAFWFPGWMVTVAEPDAELFACETALTVTVVVTLPPLPSDFVGTPLGATYNPLVDMNPVVWLPPAMASTCQVTAVLGAPFTDAVNCCVPKFATVAAPGETLTEVGDALVTVTVADADFAESACAVAVTVTCGGFGAVTGAVYSPVLEMLPLAAPPATLQVTAAFDAPVTVALNCCVFPTATLAAVGATEIVTVVLLDVLAQPKTNTAAQLRQRNSRRRMKILTGGAGHPIQTQESKSGQHRKA
jgi:hypothetical protein